MKLKTRVGLTVAVAAASVLAIGLPASAKPLAGPGGTLVYQTNMCILDELNDVGYCVNDPNASLTNSEYMQMWQRDSQGEPNNDWHGWKQGTVTTANGGWPWPNTLIELSTGQSYDSLYSGKWVVMMDFAPYDNDTNYCLYADITAPQGTGTVNGWTCTPSALNQLWVSDGNGGYINVRATWDHRNEGDSGSISMEGEYSSGALIGLDGYTGSEVQLFHWYRRYGT